MSFSVMPSAATLVDQAAGWLQHPDGWTAMCLSRLKHGHRGNFVVTNAALATVHPWLPALLLAHTEDALALNQKHILSYSGIDGADVRATLRYWTSPLTLLDTRLTTHYMAGLINTELRETATSVHLDCYGYTPAHLHALQSSTAKTFFAADTKYALNIQQTSVCVYRDWLNFAYPNWKTRWQMAQTLELPADTFTDYVFGTTASPVVPPLALPDGVTE